jgi:DNA-binding GntR family transcriptional regulator
MTTPKVKRREFSPKYSISLVEQITEFLTQAIMDGQFESGERLVENELQRRFGVSRSPIRESFRVLEKKGLVNNVPRKGTYVRKISRSAPTWKVWRRGCPWPIFNRRISRKWNPLFPG